MTQGYKYFAFISYNGADLGWGKKLQHKLEHYRMPTTLCSKRGWKRKPISPVFFAPTDIQPGELSEELKARLTASQHLIVICSPRSAQSKWVGLEIEYFASLGRKKNIHFFIVDGIPHSGNPATECFNPAIQQAGLGDVLGANIHEKISRFPWLNKERAYVQLISKLLDVEFDSLWQRHRRLLRIQIASWLLSMIALLISFALVFSMNSPFDAEITLLDSSGAKQLPSVHEAIVRIESLPEEGGEKIVSDTLHQGRVLVFKDLPHHLLDKKVRMKADAPDFYPLDTIITLSRNLTVRLHRNPSIYGNIQFRLLHADATPWTNQEISIAGQKVTSTHNGDVHLFIPLPLQSPYYIIKGIEKLEQDTLFMPLSENTVLIESGR